MPYIHDYECAHCKEVIENSYGEPDETCACGHREWNITFSKWGNFKFNARRDVYGDDELVDPQGNRRAFKASEDPTIQHLVHRSSGFQTFSEDQAKYYREKIQREDSPRLRKEILREYVKTAKENGENVPFDAQ